MQSSRTKREKLRQLIASNSVILILFSLIFLLGFPFKVSAQSCSEEEETSAQRLLALANTYEQERAWEKASDTYAMAAQSPCSTMAEEGRAGLERTLPHQVNQLRQLGTEVQSLGKSIIIGLIKVIGGTLAAIVVLYLLITIGRILIQKLDDQKSWTIMPIVDSTGNDLGEPVTEAILNILHEARFIHSRSSTTISYSENADLPSFSGLTQRESLISALNSLDTFDLSGMGLPIGSILGSIAAWLELGGQRLRGNIRLIDDRVEIAVRHEVGRDGKCIKIWRESTAVSDKDLGASKAFNEMIEKLSYQILIDIIPGSWETNSAEALRAYTAGLTAFEQFDISQKRDGGRALLEKAREFFETARKHDPTFLMAKYYLGLVELNFGNYDHSIELFKGLKSLL